MGPVFARVSKGLQHRAGRCNAVAGALSRHPVGEPEPAPHNTIFDTSLCACLSCLMLCVRQVERCQACWGQKRPFLTSGGGEAQGLEVQGMHYRIQELVYLGVDTDPGQRRPVLPPGDRTIQEARAVCHDTIALRQYLDAVPGAELSKWVRAAGLRPVLRDEAFCLAKRMTNRSAYTFRCMRSAHDSDAARRQACWPFWPQEDFGQATTTLLVGSYGYGHYQGHEDLRAIQAIC